MKKDNPKIFDAWVGLIRSHQITLDSVETDLKNAGFPPLGWYDVLLEINRHPDKKLRLQDISKNILLAKNNTTRLIDRLEKNKFVIRKKCKEDGRGVYAYITPAGEKLLKEMWPVYKKAVKTHFANHLDDIDIKTIISIYQKLKTLSEQH